MNDIGSLILDPPFDSDFSRLAAMFFGVRSALVFCDPRNAWRVSDAFGGPTWVFTWNTMSPWNSGRHRPLQQTKFCYWYGVIETYQRDAGLWGSAPEAKDHPSTQSEPLEGGRRLTDLWTESLRWLHHPELGDRSAGKVYAHQKPLGWLKCLIANTRGQGGIVYDPFCGTGTALVAAKELGLDARGVDINPEALAVTRARLDQGVFAYE